MSDDMPQAQYTALAEFRYHIRRFLRFSNDAARNVGIDPQQHQLMLVIKGAQPEILTIGDIADRMQVQHHSAVELVNRAEARHLVEREHDQTDRRQVRVKVTETANGVLRDLSEAHRREIMTAAPELIRILGQIMDDDMSVE